MASIIIAVLLLSVGFGLLIKGADMLVDGASVLAKKLGLSELLIGLTIVAFGTSLPELIVSLLASGENAPGLAAGNIVGSNIANILLILGVCAIFHPLTVRRLTVWREVLFCLTASLVLGVLVADQFLGSSLFFGLDRIDALMLLTFFTFFLYYSFGRTRVDDIQAEEAIDHDGTASLANTFLLTFVGMIMLGVGGQLIVVNATSLAILFSISEGIIGLSIVALGTSAPELAASIAAVRTKKIDIAVGNVLGSNIFNTLWVLGLAALINPLPFGSDTYFDVAVAAGAAGLLFVLMAFARPRHTINRMNGILFIALYVVYMASLVIRGVV